MCELFAMSAGQNYTAQEYLPLFADKGRDNLSGWGIGFFREGQAHIERSCEGVITGDQIIHDSFQRLARVIDSRIILSHLRCPKSGHAKESQAQPFADRFLDHQWLFIFAGESPKLAAYQSPRRLMPEPLAAARVFEFIRDGMEAQLALWPSQSLYQALAMSCRKLIDDFPGQYCFFLANETVLFAFFNHSQVLLYRYPEVLGEMLLLTTIPGGLTHDPARWQGFTNRDQTRGQILIVSGPDLLYLGHL
jgi:predicted glutamine amidotransferase